MRRASGGPTAFPARLWGPALACSLTACAPGFITGDSEVPAADSVCAAGGCDAEPARDAGAAGDAGSADVSDLHPGADVGNGSGSHDAGLDAGRAADASDTHTGGDDAGNGSGSDDAGSDAGQAADACIRFTCSAQGKDCGTIPDGCGQTLSCGDCTSGTCGGGGVANVCGGSSSAPSGQPMPVGDLPGWRQIYTDDFTTPVPLGSFPKAVSAKWYAYPDGWKDTSGNGTYTPSKVVSIANGKMNLHLHTENGVPLVSAPVPNVPGIDGTRELLYGRYAIRFRADPVPGYKTAWLLWPDSEVWPRDGEIDFPEGDLDGTISAFMHRQNGTSGGDQDAYDSDATYNDWHTAIIEWAPDHCSFILDGVTLGTSTSRIPNTPMHWVIQTETSLDGSAPSDAARGNVEIDWVAVWVPQ